MFLDLAIAKSEAPMNVNWAVNAINDRLAKKIYFTVIEQQGNKKLKFLCVLEALNKVYFRFERIEAWKKGKKVVAKKVEKNKYMKSVESSLKRTRTP